MTKILIIEGDASLLEFLSLFLEMSGFEIRAVSLEKDIKLAVEDFKPSIIILDILVGGYDGRKICREIKSANKTISVILLSTNSKLLTHYDECDADDAIEKPFDNDNILKIIKRLLNKNAL